jgi:hypothetical protein
VQTCYAFAVQAVQRHITVITMPRDCAGLSHEEIDQALARAIRTVAGLGPKVLARRRAYQDSRYLARLFRTVPPPLAAPAPLAGPPARHAPGTALRLAALGAWVVTAAAGSYLLVGWLARGGLRGRRTQVAGRPPVIVMSHAAVAVAGLGLWLAFVASAVSALAWIAAGLILPAAGLGMATLVATLPGPAVGAGPASPGPPQAQKAGTASRIGGQMPVIVIALHGVLATATLLLVLLAAIGTS